ncbi:component of SufBCD complex [Pseudogemmobacter sonorensis]|uniref:component of SufBCD complex n=1 Tax=Pseudogemmobacter sonorensis TaxID=2989681 RepID=UPI00369CC21D
MEFYRILLEVIDMRSFSNLWFWIVLAVAWSSVSRWLLGVPIDLIQRGRRQGGQVQADVEALVAINVRRILGLTRTAAVPLFFGLAFYLTTLGILAFWYWVEFAQAVFLLTAPMVLVGWLSLHAAVKVEAGENAGAALYRRLILHRRFVQGVGMVAIFITALFGMWRNLNFSVLH